MQQPLLQALSRLIFNIFHINKKYICLDGVYIDL